MLKSIFKSHPIFCAFVLMTIALVPVMLMRDMSPSNELRYLSIADEALRDGSVFTFSNHGEAYADKPPLYFWLIMLCRLVFGQHCTFVLTLFSFIPALVIIAVMDKWLRIAASLTSLKFTPEERFAAALMTGTSAMYLGMSVILRMDMLMCMFIVLSLYTFYKMFKGIGSYRANAVLFPVFIFLALFTKGPVGLLMPLVSVFCFLLFMGRLREAGRYLGWRTWLILMVLAAGWLLGVWLEGGRDYIENLLFHQTFERAVDAQYHKEPFWFYLPALLYTMAPFSLALLLYFVKSFIPKGFVTDFEKLLRTAILFTVIMLSCFSSKLSIYLAPLFPLAVYLFVLVGKRERWSAGLAASLWIPAVLLLTAGIAAFFVPSMVGKYGWLEPLTVYPFVKSPLVYVTAAVFVIFSIPTILCLIRKSWTGAVSWMSSSMLAAIFIASFLLPQINDFTGYENLCDKAREIREAENVSGYSTLMLHRPENMDVYLGEEVTSYDDKVYGFMFSDADDTVLLMNLSVLEDYTFVADRLAGCERARVGNVGIFVLKDDGESD